MQAFAALLDALSYQPARNAKLRLIETYLKETPDPDRGWALAALTSGLDFPAAKPALLRGFGEDKIGPELFHLSYDYVGDLAETLSLIWETDPDAGPPPTLGEVVDTLQTATKMQTPAILKRWLDSLDATGRWALLKLLTGALASASRRAWPSRRWPTSATSRSMPWRRSGTASRRPTGRCSTGCCTTRPGPAAMPAAPSCRRCWPIPSSAPSSTRSIRRTSAPNGNGTASACRSPRRAA